MDRRLALGLALASAALAVTIVALDLSWNVTAALQEEQDGAWVDLSRATNEQYFYPEPYFPGQGCATGPLRVVVENSHPWGRSVDVHITFYNGTSDRTETLLQDTWTVAGSSQFIHSLDLPASAYVPRSDPDGTPIRNSGSVTVQIGDRIHLSTCLEGSA
jgi:hypothetical protein